MHVLLLTLLLAGAAPQDTIVGQAWARGGARRTPPDSCGSARDPDAVLPGGSGLVLRPVLCLFRSGAALEARAIHAHVSPARACLRQARARGRTGRAAGAARAASRRAHAATGYSST
jgi:hypothetical protein